MSAQNYCWSECPHNEHRHCNVGGIGHTGDHAYIVTYDGRQVIVASWPGPNSKVQTSPSKPVVQP